MNTVRPLTPDLLPSATALLADAFFTNPAHVYICPDAKTRRAALEWLLGGNLRLKAELRASFCLADGDIVNAMGFWTRSTDPDVGLLRSIRAGILAAPFHLRLSGIGRLLEVTRGIDDHLAGALGDKPFWYLNNMVIREELRGTGIGSRLLREQVARVAGREPTYAIALSTQRPENVVFYRRLGFQVASELSIGTGRDAFRNWTMLHAPQSGGGQSAPVAG